MRTVIIIGASGHGKVVADIIQKSGDIVYGFLDDNTELKNDFLGFPILGKIENYKKYKHIAEFIIAIGDAHVRSDISKKLQDVKIYTAVHPAAVISGLDVSIVFYHKYRGQGENEKVPKDQKRDWDEKSPI